MPLNNFGVVAQVGGAKLYRAAQPDEVGLGSAHGMGICTIVRLNDEGMPLADEQTAFQGTIVYRPMGTLTFDLNTAKSIVTQIVSILASGQSVLVHCSHGRDRTGGVIGAYRIMENEWTLAQVNAERADYGVGILEEMPDVMIEHTLAELAGSM